MVKNWKILTIKVKTFLHYKYSLEPKTYDVSLLSSLIVNLELAALLLPITWEPHPTCQMSSSDAIHFSVRAAGVHLLLREFLPVTPRRSSNNLSQEIVT